MPKRMIYAFRPKPVIYVLQVQVPHSVVKIGYTHDMKQRLLDIRQYFPFPLPITVVLTHKVETEEVARDMEKQLHELHSAARLKGEWFALGVEEAVASVLSCTPTPPAPVREWILL